MVQGLKKAENKIVEQGCQLNNRMKTGLSAHMRMITLHL